MTKSLRDRLVATLFIVIVMASVAGVAWLMRQTYVVY
jgi:hypothetical protein